MARLTPMPMKAPWASLLSRTVVGESYSCAEGSDGGANCWGNNGLGQLRGRDEDESRCPRRRARALGRRLLGDHGGERSHVCRGIGRQDLLSGNDMNGRVGQGAWADCTTPIAVLPPKGGRPWELAAGTEPYLCRRLGRVRLVLGLRQVLPTRGRGEDDAPDARDDRAERGEE